jgi:aspartate racemase
VKTIGLVGGMSWESTIPYYRHINEAVRSRLGGLHSARILLVSVDFHDIEALMRAERWDDVGAAMARAARVLESAGADLLVLCTNTMHRVAPAVESAVRIPLCHIVDPTADGIRRAQLSTVGLLGTRFTMEQAFYRDRLRRHGLEVLVPPPLDRETIDRIIFEELCLGRLLDESRRRYRQAIAGLVERGAQAIVLGCTEISLLIGQADSAVPLFDTTELHARAAAQWALEVA